MVGSNQATNLFKALETQDNTRKQPLRFLLYSLQKRLPSIQSKLWLVGAKEGGQYRISANFDALILLKERGHKHILWRLQSTGKECMGRNHRERNFDKSNIIMLELFTVSGFSDA